MTVTGRRITRSTAAYSVAAILQRATPLLLLPLFARILTPEEFGQIGIATTIAAAVAVVVSLGLESAVFRGYVQAASTRDKGSFITTVGGFALVAPFALSVVFGITIAPALGSLFDIPVDALRLAGIGAAFSASSTLVPLALLRAQERLGDYLQLTGVQVMVLPVLTVVFVITLHLAVTGWMLAYAIANAVLLFRGLALVRQDWSGEFNFEHLQRALTFGLPLVPHAISHWALAVSDRAILGAFVAAATVGGYYVAYLFSLPVSLVAIALSQATQPLFAEASTSDDQWRQLASVSEGQAIVVWFVAISAALLGPTILLLALPREYAPAAEFIPWLAVGAGLFGLYLVPVSAIVLTAGRTSHLWAFTVVAAMTNVALNFVFVPRLGPIAAAINTTAGYGVLLVCVFVYSRWIGRPAVPIEPIRIALGLLLMTVPAALAAVLTPEGTLMSLVIRSIVVAGIAGAFLFVGPLRPQARAALQAIRSAGAEGRL
jgi:O-antigen/teichoic acid export membrane protein